jgi:hypothetical protein
MTTEEFANLMGARALGKFEDIVATLTPEQRIACATEFEVHPDTVDRWAKGPTSANPHPSLRWQVVQWVLRTRAN